MKKNSLLEQTIASVSKGVFARLEEFLSFCPIRGRERDFAYLPFKNLTESMSVSTVSRIHAKTLSRCDILIVGSLVIRRELNQIHLYHEMFNIFLWSELYTWPVEQLHRWGVTSNDHEKYQANI